MAYIKSFVGRNISRYLILLKYYDVIGFNCISLGDF